MDDKTIIVQMLDSTESDQVTREAIAALEKHFGETYKVLPGVIHHNK
jgi:hypothetical protein